MKELILILSLFFIIAFTSEGISFYIENNKNKELDSLNKVKLNLEIQKLKK